MYKLNAHLQTHCNTWRSQHNWGQQEDGKPLRMQWKRTFMAVSSYVAPLATAARPVTSSVSGRPGRPAATARFPLAPLHVTLQRLIKSELPPHISAQVRPHSPALDTDFIRGLSPGATDDLAGGRGGSRSTWSHHKLRFHYNILLIVVLTLNKTWN